ncbi:MAG: hypothetical protein ACRBF0_04440 [Calditrichia bacterium]
MRNTYQKLALILGVSFAILFWIAVWFKLNWFSQQTTGYVSPHLFSYNIPITTIFAVYALELFFSVFFPPSRKSLLEHAPYLIIWGVGFVQLYLRLVTHSIDISGHMTWAGLMVAHSVLRKFPRWMHLCAMAVWLHAAYFNYILWGTSSGVNGTILGIVLSVLLIVLNRLRNGR